MSSKGGNIRWVGIALTIIALTSALDANTVAQSERFRLVRSTAAVVLLRATGDGDGAVFDGSPEAGRASLGCGR